MGEQDTKNVVHAERDQTNESLRLERDRADARDAEKPAAVEAEADEVVRLARERADQVVQTARDDADRQAPPQSPATEANAERTRDRADNRLEKERSDADAVVEHERAERKRYLADFLALEREATDADLIGERAHSDTVIAARDEFLATVSHDLRSLLGGLSLSADLIFKHAPAGDGGEKVRKHAATSQRLVGRMNRLINDLLDVASIEAGQLAYFPVQIEIAKLLADTVEAFAPIAAAKQLTFEAQCATEVVYARIDGERILQVLANLVSNAFKFTQAGGRISIRVHSANGELFVTVSDTGIGIPEDALPTVFERFRQVHKNRAGLGLGLHISKCIVEAHGGRMWAESTLGAGSVFHFSLPLNGSPPG